MGVGGQYQAPTTSPPGKRRNTHCKKAGWAAEPVCMGMEILPSPGFNPGTIQPIAGCYADYTILVTPKCVHNSVKGIHIIW